MSTSKSTPPATTTVINALTATPPVVWGVALRPVTIAHVIALEKMGNPLVLPNGERKPDIHDNIVALVVLAKDGKEILFLDEETAHSAARLLASEHAPHEIASMCTSVQSWLYASFETHIAAKSEGGGNGPFPAAATASDGPLN